MKPSRQLRISTLAIRAAALVALFTTPVWSADPPGYPDSVMDCDIREVALLPRYCLYTQMFRDRVPGANNPAEINKWSATLGETFHALHHYCFGLMDTNRAMMLARTQRYKQFYLQASINEFDYVIRVAPTDFPLLPEILARKGQNLIRLGRGPLGVEELKRATALKEDYWPPYAYMSDYYVTIGDVKTARDLLAKASSLAPNAKAVQRRLAELDNPKNGARSRRATTDVAADKE